MAFAVVVWRWEQGCQAWSAYWWRRGRRVLNYLCSTSPPCVTLHGLLHPLFSTGALSTSCMLLNLPACVSPCLPCSHLLDGPGNLRWLSSQASFWLHGCCPGFYQDFSTSSIHRVISQTSLTKSRQGFSRRFLRNRHPLLAVPSMPGWRQTKAPCHSSWRCSKVSPKRPWYLIPEAPSRA